MRKREGWRETGGEKIRVDDRMRGDGEIGDNRWQGRRNRLGADKEKRWEMERGEREGSEKGEKEAAR